MIIIKEDKESTFFVGKNIYNDEANEVEKEEELEVTWKDILAMTLAMYKLIFPFLFGGILILILIGAIFL